MRTWAFSLNSSLGTGHEKRKGPGTNQWGMGSLLRFCGPRSGVAYLLVPSPRSSCSPRPVAPSLQPAFSANFLVCSRHRPLWGGRRLRRWRPMSRLCVKSRSRRPTGKAFTRPTVEDLVLSTLASRLSCCSDASLPPAAEAPSFSREMVE
jgi:hypothetical protein